MFEYEKYMSKYENETMNHIHFNLSKREKEWILITHDKCIFYSNDNKYKV